MSVGGQQKTRLALAAETAWQRQELAALTAKRHLESLQKKLLRQLEVLDEWHRLVGGGDLEGPIALRDGLGWECPQKFEVLHVVSKNRFAETGELLSIRFVVQFSIQVRVSLITNTMRLSCRSDSCLLETSLDAYVDDIRSAEAEESLKNLATQLAGEVEGDFLRNACKETTFVAKISEHPHYARG